MPDEFTAGQVRCCCAQMRPLMKQPHACSDLWMAVKVVVNTTSAHARGVIEGAEGCWTDLLARRTVRAAMQGQVGACWACCGAHVGFSGWICPCANVEETAEVAAEMPPAQDLLSGPSKALGVERRPQWGLVTAPVLTQIGLCAS